MSGCDFCGSTSPRRSEPDCLVCLNKRTVFCEFCNSHYHHKTHQHKCSICGDIGKHLDYDCSNKVPPKVEGYYLEIKLRVREPEHDGYCSDAESDTGEEHDVVESLRPGTEDHFVYRTYFDRLGLTPRMIAKIIEKALLDGSDIKQLLLKTVSGDPESQKIEISCDQGSGWCGYKGFVAIMSVIIKSRTQ